MVSGADKRVEFVAYSAQTVSGRLREVYTEAELLACVQEAQAAGWTVTFRGGGMAFDTHALNDGMVIQLRGFDEIGDVVDGTITVGANARWDAILEKTCASGHLPYVLVSTEYATVGGTISADSLSRFSPSCGKEGNHVERLRFMKVDGTVLECSRETNGDVFRGAISGVGLLGVVLSVTYRLLRVPHARTVVQTDFERFRGLRSLADRLVAAVDEHHATLLRPDGAAPSRDALGAVQVHEAVALSGVVYMNAPRDGFVMRSSYVEGAGRPLDPSPFHQPKSFTQRLLQVLVKDRVNVVGRGRCTSPIPCLRRRHIGRVRNAIAGRVKNDAIRVHGSRAWPTSIVLKGRVRSDVCVRQPVRLVLALPKPYRPHVAQQKRRRAHERVERRGHQRRHRKLKERQRRVCRGQQVPARRVCARGSPDPSGARRKRHPAAHPRLPAERPHTYAEPQTDEW